MNILFSTSYYYPYVSGLTIYVERIAEALIHKNHDITIITNQHERSLPRKEVWRGVNIIRIPYQLRISKAFIGISWLFNGWKTISEHSVVVINLPQPEGWLVGVMAKLQRKKLIAIFTCDVILENKFSEIMLRISSWLVLHIADVITTYTRDYAIHSKLAGSIENKVRYIFPPITKLEINNEVLINIKKMVGKSDVVIGLASRLSSEKGVEYLMEAIPKIKATLNNKRVKVLMAGPLNPVGEEKYCNRILSLARKYEDSLMFLGSIPPNDMGAFYSAINILVLPSINSTESFGMVQVEAMQSGVPVIATDLPGIRVPIQVTGMGILVPIRNSDAIADAIVKIVNNYKSYLALRNKALRIFDFKKTINNFEELLTIDNYEV